MIAAPQPSGFNCRFIAHAKKPHSQEESGELWNKIVSVVKERQLHTVALNFGTTQTSQSVEQFIEMVLRRTYDKHATNLTITATVLRNKEMPTKLQLAAQQWLRVNQTRLFHQSQYRHAQGVDKVVAGVKYWFS